MKEIYDGKCVSKTASKEMLNYLEDQQNKKKIPAGVEGTKTANKTGELDKNYSKLVESDAAIVYKEGNPYILAVMSQGISNSNTAIEHIVQISKLVYQNIGKENTDENTNDSSEEITTTVDTKIYDLQFMPEENFNELVESNDPLALDYYTLDSDWQLITAKWSYNPTDEVQISKNTAINYRSVISKYTTPFEYLMDFYINIKDDDFISDFADLALKSEFIIAVRDDITTTETESSSYVSYEDGETANATSEKDFSETVTTSVELTYADNWFVNFSRDITYKVGDTKKNDEISYELTNTTQEVLGKSSESASTSTSSIEGPTKAGIDEEGNEITIGSTQYTTTTKHSISVKYAENQGEGEVKSNEDKFYKLFDDNPDAKNSLKDTWLARLVENGERTAQFTDLTKYLLYHITKNKLYEDVSIDAFLSRYKNNEFASLKKLRGNTIQEKVWIALRSMDYSEEAVAGAMGNIHYESGGFNPESVEGGYAFDVAGIGICQWTNYPRNSGNGRHTNLIKYAESKNKDWSDEDIQVEYLVSELTVGGGCNGLASYQLMSNNGYNPSDWSDAKTVENATQAFCWTFERPLVVDGNASMNKRIQWAQHYYDLYAGVPLSSFGGGDILDVCEEVMNEWIRRGVHYSLTTLTDHNIEASYNGSYACCATFVSCVLWKAGYLDEDFLNKPNYYYNYTGINGASGVSQILKDAGWTRITNVNDVQEGDVINDPGDHIMFYAGGNLIWDQRSAVVSSGGTAPTGGPREGWATYARMPDIEIWRAP